MRISRELGRTAYIQVTEKGFIKEGNKKRTGVAIEAGRRGCTPQHPKLLKDSRGRKKLRRKTMKVVIEDRMALRC